MEARERFKFLEPKIKIIIRKTKCARVLKRNVQKSKTKRPPGLLFYHPLSTDLYHSVSTAFEYSLHTTPAHKYASTGSDIKIKIEWLSNSIQKPFYFVYIPLCQC